MVQGWWLMSAAAPAIGRWAKRSLARLKDGVNRSSRVLYGEDMLPAEASTFERAGAGMTTLVISSPLDREDLRAASARANC